MGVCLVGKGKGGREKKMLICIRMAATAPAPWKPEPHWVGGGCGGGARLVRDGRGSGEQSQPVHGATTVNLTVTELFLTNAQT